MARQQGVPSEALRPRPKQCWPCVPLESKTHKKNRKQILTDSSTQPRAHYVPASASSAELSQKFSYDFNGRQGEAGPTVASRYHAQNASYVWLLGGYKEPHTRRPSSRRCAAVFSLSSPCLYVVTTPMFDVKVYRCCR